MYNTIAVKDQTPVHQVLNHYGGEFSMGKFRCLSCKSEFELDEKESLMRCPRCGSRFMEVLDGTNRKRGKSWSSKSFSVGKSAE